MKRTFVGFLIAQALGGWAWAQPLSSEVQLSQLASVNAQRRVTHSFQNADLAHVLAVLAKEMGYAVYLAPTVFGKVTIELVDVPAREAVRLVLAKHGGSFDFKLLDSPGSPTMVVAPPDKLAAISSSVLSADKAPPTVLPRPSRNVAFYATGQVSAGSPIWSQEEAESYAGVDETGYREVSKRPLSTFSIDVDTASYANVRRFLKEGRLPPVDAVRIEELINYFRYDYPQPKTGVPFSIATELTGCPWNSEHQLLRIGLQGQRTEVAKTPPRNLVFLLDVSGSMTASDKLPLVKRALQMMLATMGKDDHVAIVVYAGSEGLALPSTSCDRKELISERIESLEPGGATHGSAGIRLAYETARKNLQKGAINRVILCTDGDFNVGLTGGSLTSLIEKEREHGIFLTVLGFGTGNIKDDTMESLADKGNGNYAYIDSLHEARKVLVREAGSTLETIAKDVKLQIEFNPKRVHSYRLVGYENRRLEDEDFANDKKDAGELGSGHNVTALYELVTSGQAGASDLRYQTQAATTDKADSGELALVKLRYKEPTGETSKLMEIAVSQQPVAFDQASQDLRFAASVAAFGMVLRDSEFKGQADFSQVGQWAASSTGKDPHGDRKEFLQLIDLASTLKRAEKRD